LIASDIYPGIDLEYALGETLRFGFVVAPEADVDAIQLDFDADVELRVEPRAAEIDVLDDQAAAPAMTVRLSRLRAWQEDPSGKVEVDVRFVPRGGGLGFALGPHDPARPVYIDPDITYASYIGSTNLDQALDVAVDASSMVYVAGRTQNPGTLFPTTSGALQPSPPGGFDAFVLKVDPSQTGASSLVYGSFLGGQFDDFGEGVDVDANGRAIVGGITSFASGNTFPTTANAYSRTPQSSFVSILNAAGSQLVYSTFLGSVGTTVTTVRVAPSGNFIAAGRVDSNGVIPLVNNIPVTAVSTGYVLEFDLTRSGSASVVYGTRIDAAPMCGTPLWTRAGSTCSGPPARAWPPPRGPRRPRSEAGRTTSSRRSTRTASGRPRSAIRRTSEAPTTKGAPCTTTGSRWTAPARPSSPGSPAPSFRPRPGPTPRPRPAAARAS
jgi:hypothetical protein